MRSLVHDAVHCVWNDWVIGDCSVTCGEGVRTNTRTQKEAAQFGGDECEGLASSTESCYDQDCPGIFLLTHSFVVLQSSYFYLPRRSYTIDFVLIYRYTTANCCNNTRSSARYIFTSPS